MILLNSLHRLNFFSHVLRINIQFLSSRLSKYFLLNLNTVWKIISIMCTLYFLLANLFSSCEALWDMFTYFVSIKKLKVNKWLLFASYWLLKVVSYIFVLFPSVFFNFCISLIHHNLYCARKYRIQLFYATASIPLCTEILLKVLHTITLTPSVMQKANDLNLHGIYSKWLGYLGNIVK